MITKSTQVKLLKDIPYTGSKSFDSFRYLFSISEEAFDKFASNDIALGTIESIFAENQIYPYGVAGAFFEELGWTTYKMEQYQVLLSYVASRLDDGYFKELFEDIRMAAQGFLVSLAYRSYASAFLEYRRFLEGILWIEYYSSNEGIVQRIDSSDNYSKQFNSLSPELLKAWAFFSNYFHAKDGEFNIDLDIDKNDMLFKSSVMVQEITKTVDSTFYKLFDISFIADDESMKRFKTLMLANDKAVGTYNLSDLPVKPTTKETFTRKFVNEYLEFVSKQWSPFKRSSYIESYTSTVSNMKQMIRQYQMEQIQHNGNLSRDPWELTRSWNYFNEKFFAGEQAAQIKLFTSKGVNNFLDMARTDSYAKSYRKELGQLKEVCKKLISKEANNPKYLEIYKVRVLVEEMISNIYYGSVTRMSLFSHILMVLKSDYEISKQFTKYRHILSSGRIRSVSSEGETTGEIANPRMSLNIILKELQRFADTL